MYINLPVRKTHVQKTHLAIVLISILFVLSNEMPKNLVDVYFYEHLPNAKTRALRYHTCYLQKHTLRFIGHEL